VKLAILYAGFLEGTVPFITKMIPIFSLFQSQPHVWADVAYQAVISLGPALITAAVSWLAFRSQLKLKDKEIDAQARLKARELMFNSYQGLLERREHDAVEIGKVLGSLGVAFQLAEDDDEQRTARVALMQSIGGILMSIRSIVDDLESQLANCGLSEKFKLQMSYIKDHADLDFMSVPYNQIPAQYNVALTLLSYYSLIQQAIVEKRRQDLFRDYLPKS
jgi:hypothetical protein